MVAHRAARLGCRGHRSFEEGLAVASPITTPAPVGRRSLTYVPGLDGVRGLAILMVVGLHVGYILRANGKSYLPGGFLGVDVFFVLSGYLITALLLKERSETGGNSFRKFYARRACRLLPALAAVLLVHLLYALQQGLSLRRELEALASIAFYVSNLTQSAHHYMPAELSHTWSLAVEEQFYFVWPAAFVLLMAWLAHRRNRETQLLPWLFGAAIAATVAIRIIVWRSNGFPAAYMLPFCRADALLVGCGLAFWRRHGNAGRKVTTAAGWAGLIGLLCLAFFWSETSSAMYYGGFTVVAVLSAAVINAVLERGRGLAEVFSVRPLVAIGRVSYGLYLWHILLIALLVQHTAGHVWWGPKKKAAVGLALSAVATVVSWFLIERPVLRLKDRFQPGAPRPAASLETAPAAG